MGRRSESGCSVSTQLRFQGRTSIPVKQGMVKFGVLGMRMVGGLRMEHQGGMKDGESMPGSSPCGAPTLGEQSGWCSTAMRECLATVSAKW